MNNNQYSYNYTPIGAPSQSSTPSVLNSTAGYTLQPDNQPKNPNFIESLLPTGGSIGGGLGGAALGATLGSIVPGIGTAIGGILGGALGSAGGAAAGQVGENALTGQDLGENVGNEALTSGVLGLLGGGLGGVAKAVGGRAAGNLATDLFKGQAPVSAMTSDVANAGLKYGLKSPQEMANLGKVITGDVSQAGDTALSSKFVRQMGNNNFAIEGSPNSQVPIDISDFNFPTTTASKTAMQSASAGNNNIVKNALLNSNLLGSKAQSALQKEVQGIVENASQGATAGGGTTFDQALAMQSAFSKRAAELMDAAHNNTTGSTLASDQAKFYQTLSNTMKDRLGLAETGPNAITLTKDQIGNLADSIEATGANGAKQYAQELRNLPDGTSLGQIRSMESPFIDNSQAIQQLENTANKSNGTNVNSMLGSAGVGTGVGLLTQNPLAGVSAGLLTKALGHGKVAGQFTGLLNRFSQLTPAEAATRVGVPAGALGALATSGSTGNNQELNMGQTPGGNMSTANNQGGNADQEAISTLYNTLLNQYLSAPSLDNGTSSQLISVLGALAPKVQAAQELNNMTNGLGLSYFNNRAPANIVQGVGNLISGAIPGTAANQFVNQRNLVGNLYSELYGVNPSVSTSALPNLLQSPSTAAVSGGNYGGVLSQL